MKITATVVKDATIMPDIYYIWDSEIKGFGLKVIPNGMKKFLIKYRIGGGGRRANQKWFILGESATMKVDVARKLASEMLVKVSNGGDPQNEKQDERLILLMSFGTCLKRNMWMSVAFPPDINMV